MEALLLLVHRIPYPPNKGDKIRSYNLLRHLAARYRIFLGTFVDQPEDLAHVDALRSLCADIKVERIRPTLARIRSLAGLLTGEPLTLPFYRNAAMARWVQETVAAHSIERAVVFSSAMMQYVMSVPGLRVVADFVDVDSAKWTQYADEHRWPLSALYRREGAKLLDFERVAAARSDACVLVTEAETRLFAKLAPEHARKLHAIGNGVDGQYFRPSSDRASPYRQDELAVVFTGVMNYWPNIDAVTWFAQSILPRIVAIEPKARFYIVGMDPPRPVQELARDPHVVVTGKVPDVRPYVQHAAVVVAPLRIARGVQNKVLEAMAMERPVVVSRAAAQGVGGEPGVDFEVADDEATFAQSVLRLIGKEPGLALGRCARLRVTSDYSWDKNLAAFGQLLAVAGEAPQT